MQVSAEEAARVSVYCKSMVVSLATLAKEQVLTTFDQIDHF